MSLEVSIQSSSGPAEVQELPHFDPGEFQVMGWDGGNLETHIRVELVIPFDIHVILNDIYILYIYIFNYTT